VRAGGAGMLTCRSEGLCGIGESSGVAFPVLAASASVQIARWF